MAKRNLYREKVVDIYDKFFMGQDITGGKEDFWDEFFLLKTNINELNHHFKLLSIAQLMCLKPQMNRLNAKCVETILVDNWYRSANAAQTLQTFVNGIFSSTTMLGQSENLIDILFGKEEYEDITKDLIKRCHCIIFNQTPIRLKAIILNLLLGLVTATNLIQENPLIELMLNDDLLSDIVFIISDYTYRSLLGKEAMFLVTLMMQYNRNQDNLFRLKMSGIEEQIVLNGISHLISLMYVEFIGRSAVIPKQSGLFSSFASMFGSFISRTETTQNVKITESCFLLTLFDFLQLNSHFSYIITSPHSVFQCPSMLDEEEITDKDMSVQSSSSIITNQNEIKQNQPISDLGTVCEDPTNIIAVFLEYCSIVMQDIREPSAYNNCRLCFLILLSLSEDQNTATTLHDTHLAFKVTIHKKQMRHRKLNEDKNNNNPRPLVCGILDVTVEFMLCHIMKAFPSDLFNIIFDVIYRLVCFQKSRRLRIRYDWKSLWNCLINVTKYLISNFEDLPKTCDIYQLLDKIEVIFNLFITYGDAFLYCPTVYDHLYYEIIRQAIVFENLYNFLIRTSVSKVEKDEFIHVFDHLINIRAIIQHFNPRIQAFAEENHISCLTPEQILEIISDNYDSLTLKLHKNLEKYELYTSNTEKEMAFFDILTRAVVIDIRDWSLVRCRELQNNLKEILISQQKLVTASTSQQSTVKPSSPSSSLLSASPVYSHN